MVAAPVSVSASSLACASISRSDRAKSWWSRSHPRSVLLPAEPHYGLAPSSLPRALFFSVCALLRIKRLLSSILFETK